MKKTKRPNKHETSTPAKLTSEENKAKGMARRAKSDDCRPSKGSKKDNKADSQDSKQKRGTNRRAAAGNKKNRLTCEDGETAEKEKEETTRNTEKRDSKVLVDIGSAKVRLKDPRKKSQKKKEKDEKEASSLPPPASTATNETVNEEAAPRSQFVMVNWTQNKDNESPASHFISLKKEASDKKAKAGQRNPKTTRKKRTYIEEDRRVEEDHEKMEKEQKEKDECPVELNTNTDATETTTPTQKEKSETTQSEGRARWALTIARRKMRPLLKEFAENRKYLPKDLSTDSFNKNTSKNRYADVYCTDSTRVILKNRDEDYIHANWLCIPNSGQKFICTQGPLDETCEDFWHMIVQEKVSVIVMLCGVMEGGTEKCSQYWPLSTGDSMKHGNFTIRNEKASSTNIDTVKSTTLDVSTRDDRMTVLHYQWADWPDHLAPTDPKPAVELLKLSKSSGGNRPIVVHCSAGIGRTGTFCGIDFASERLKTDPSLTLIDIMKEMRQQRVHSIQTTLQYLYLHCCVLEHFVRNGYVKNEQSIRSFTREYEKYLNKFKARTAAKS